jgi:hypothetical protein
MCFVNRKLFLQARLPLLVLAGGLLSLSVLVFASTPEHQEKKNRVVETELITVTQRGFEPEAITRPRGEFILMIENPDRQELQLSLSREKGASLHRIKATREEPHWNELQDLPPGRYVLRDDANPEWTCVITITAH